MLRAQDALLTSMLPDFIIEPLTVWLASNFDPQKAVARNHEEICVAFIRMSPGAAIATSEGHGADTEGGESKKVQLAFSNSQEDDDGDDDGSSDWLFVGHRAIDKVLASNPIIDKVKTVGDLVIVAGSFRGHTSTEAAKALLSAMVSIHNNFSQKSAGEEEEKNSVTIGLHVGPVMAIVLGFSRLAFDIFGDTVNTTSRVMTSAQAKHKITGQGVGKYTRVYS